MPEEEKKEKRFNIYTVIDEAIKAGAREDIGEQERFNIYTVLGLIGDKKEEEGAEEEKEETNPKTKE